jgi:hypothetical protein
MSLNFEESEDILNEEIKHLKKEERSFKIPNEFSNNCYIKNEEEYQNLYEKSIDQTEKFWSEVAESDFYWEKKWFIIKNKRIREKTLDYNFNFENGKLY